MPRSPLPTAKDRYWLGGQAAFFPASCVRATRHFPITATATGQTSACILPVTFGAPSCRAHARKLENCLWDGSLKDADDGNGLWPARSWINRIAPRKKSLSARIWMILCFVRAGFGYEAVFGSRRRDPPDCVWNCETGFATRNGSKNTEYRPTPSIAQPFSCPTPLGRTSVDDAHRRHPTEVRLRYPPEHTQGSGENRLPSKFPRADCDLG